MPWIQVSAPPLPLFPCAHRIRAGRVSHSILWTLSLKLGALVIGIAASESNDLYHRIRVALASALRKILTLRWERGADDRHCQRAVSGVRLVIG
jgi:hypothetical protein